MTATEPQFLHVGRPEHERRIAYLCEAGREGAGPGLVWRAGLKSDMVSTKAAALAEWAAARGLPMTRFDYSGHGRSSGRFEDAVVGDWLEEARSVLTKLTRGAQILVGSSMGWNLTMLLLRGLMCTGRAEAQRDPCCRRRPQSDGSRVPS